MTEPLADDREEVLYFVCTHPRLLLLDQLADGDKRIVVRANGSNFGTEIQWEPKPWARLTLPDHVRRSRVPWAVLDPALETVEGLQPVGFDPSRDPDGLSGQHRQELLAWIFDRHLEDGMPEAEKRGSVEGGQLDFRLEYIGMSNQEALRRAAGAHHKIPQILGYTLVYEPHRTMYLFPCDLRVTRFDPDGTTEGDIEMKHLAAAAEEYSIPRQLLVSAAEDMLIAWLGASYNVIGTGSRRFPSSHSATELASLGYSVASINVQGLPAHVTVRGTNAVAGDGPTFPGWRLPSTAS